MAIRFYMVSGWCPNMGPFREHFPSKRKAMARAREIIQDKESEHPVDVGHHVMPTGKAELLLALDHTANLGSEGATWLPGTATAIAEVALDGTIKWADEP